jgi:hypothetical protein
VAEAAFAFECTAGNEEILAEMAMSARGYVRQRAERRARALREEGGR